jgi:methyltransferase
MLYLLVAFIIVQRLLELRVARRNLKWALEQGGKEYSPEHYPAMVALHTTWIAALLIEGLARGSQLSSFWGLWFGLFVLAQFGRYWVINTLGRYWNTRIVIIPGGQRVTRGLYAFIPHPNYAIVALELFCTPLIFGAWITALVFTVLNAWLLLGVRIPAENRALETYLQTNSSSSV